MKVIIVGCGRIGAELAYRLSKRNVDVSVIDLEESTFSNLPSDFHGRQVEGDALNRDTLHRAGIEHADALVAVTNKDALNAVICHTAREYYGVEQVVARNYNSSTRAMFEVFNVQVISGSTWAAQRMEEMVYHSEVRTVYSTGNGEIEIYEFTIPTSWDGQKISEVVPASGCAIVSVSHAGQATLAGNDTLLRGGDILHISATFEGVEAMRSRLHSAQEVKK
jgi:trk system potassium uptake protein TrkA